MIELAALIVLAILGYRWFWPSRSAHSDSDWWAWYTDYLNSPQWKAKRKAVLLRAGGRCERCHQQKPIQCHHLPGSYQRIPHELPWDLAALCYDCHRAEHPGKRF